MLIKLFSLLGKDDKRKSFFLLGLMIFGACLEALGIGLIIPILATFNQEDSFPELLKPLTFFVEDQSSVEFILLLFVLLAIFFVFKNLYLGIMYWFQYKFIYFARANLSKRVLSWYLNESISFHKSRNSAKLLNSLVNDTNIFSSHGLLPVLIIITESLVLFTISVLLLIIAPAPTVIIVISLGAILTIYSALFKKKISLWGEKRIISESLRVKSIHQGLGSIKEILLRSSQDFFLKDYELHNRKVASVMSNQATIQSFPRLIFETSTILLFCLYIFVSSSRGVPILDTIGVLTLFAFASVRLMPSVSRLTGAFQNFRFAYPVIEDFYKDIDLLSIKRDINLNQLGSVFKESISIQNISYTYEGSEQLILDNFTESIHFGDCIGIVGKSGSGKSTLADILLGLIEPTSGKIFIDSNSLNNVKNQWQQTIGYVPQDVYLLDDSLKNNIAFGIEEKNIDKKMLDNAINLAQLNDFIEELPKGVDTVIGERGSKLSGGQRQRIGIARALYNKPGILIFDEATSALDVKTEKDLVNAIHSLKGKITMIVIAHRMSALESCDRIINLS